MHKFLKFIFGINLYMFRTFSMSKDRNFFTVHIAVGRYADRSSRQQNRD